MPQMAPLNWLPLMLMFILVLLIINCINYFSVSYLPLKKNIKTEKLNVNWKW